MLFAFSEWETSSADLCKFHIIRDSEQCINDPINKHFQTHFSIFFRDNNRTFSEIYDVDYTDAEDISLFVYGNNATSVLKHFKQILIIYFFDFLVTVTE